MNQNVFKRTKILATVGPAVHSQEKIQAMLDAGVDGFRLNFSHGATPDRLEQISWVRQASKKANKPVAILQDLQGPKIRLGILVDNMLTVTKGDVLTLDSSLEEHDGGFTLPVQFNLAEKMKVGEPLYMFDGKVHSVVTEIVSQTAIKVEIQNDGFLMSRKGLNLPDTDFGGDILTVKDIEDLEWGTSQDFDYVSLSFVQTANDIEDLRARLVERGSKAHVIAKIETKAAIHEDNLEAIVMASDGIMVARGDLAVEAGAELVPVVQQRIVSLCRKHGKLVIVATQMMGSMVDNPEPSRAEVNDVATAVLQGADTVMLSDETANGKYPIEAIKAMQKTIMYTQEHGEVMLVDKSYLRRKKDAAISYAAISLAHDVGAPAIIAETSGGSTATNLAAFRSEILIIGMTDHERTAQQLALSYGTCPFVRQSSGLESAGELAEELKREGYFGSDSAIAMVFVSGYAPGKPGTTNNIQVRVL